MVMGSGIRFLIMDDDMMKMLPEHLDSRRTWDAVQNEFGSTEIIFIAFGNKGESVYKSRPLADLWTLSNGLKNLSSVMEVSNITTSTRIDQVDGFMQIEELQKIQNLNSQEIKSIQLYLDKNNNIKKQFVISKAPNFYSNEMIITKKSLIENQLKYTYQKQLISDLDYKHKEWSKFVGS